MSAILHSTRLSSGIVALPGKQQRLHRHRIIVAVAAHDRVGSQKVSKKLSKKLERLLNRGSQPVLMEHTVAADEISDEDILAQREFLEAQISKMAAEDDDEAPSTSANPAVAFLRRHLPPSSKLPDQLQSVLERLPQVPERVQGLIMLNALVLLVASNWVVVKEQGAAFDPFLFSALRFGVATLAFSPFLAAAIKNPKIIKAGLELGFWAGIGYLAQAEGLLTTDASRASFLSTFTVLVVPFLAGMSGRGVSSMTIISAIAALFGTSLLEQSGSPPSIGDAWSILSAIGFGVQMFRTERWSRDLDSEATLPLMSVMLVGIAGMALVAAGVTHVPELVSMVHDPQGMMETVSNSSIPWAEVMYTGILTTDLALLLELLALKYVTSTEAAITYTLEPVLGAGFAFMMLGESFGGTGYLGAAIILTSCIATQLYSEPEELSTDAKSE